jgi:hypothetical protein
MPALGISITSDRTTSKRKLSSFARAAALTVPQDVRGKLRADSPVGMIAIYGLSPSSTPHIIQAGSARDLPTPPDILELQMLHGNTAVSLHPGGFHDLREAQYTQ